MANKNQEQKHETIIDKILKVFKNKTLWKRALLTIAILGIIAFFVFVDLQFERNKDGSISCGTKTHLDPTRK